MPKEAGAGFDPTREQIGSGPWMLGSVEPDIAVAMTRNPGWFKTAEPLADSVRAVIIPEVAQEIAQF